VVDCALSQVNSIKKRASPRKALMVNSKTHADF
jgi:hypothetical protein